jgi:hypothetical protein
MQPCQVHRRPKVRDQLAREHREPLYGMACFWSSALVYTWPIRQNGRPSRLLKNSCAEPLGC